MALQGKSRREISDALGISVRAVAAHLKRLLDSGELRIATRKERGTPIYAPGARGVNFTLPPSGGAHPATEGGLPVRVHRGGWAFPVRWLGRLVQAPVWEARWNPNARSGAPTDYRLVRDGWGFWLKVGKEEAVLMVEPPEELVSSAAQVRAADERRSKASRERALAFADEHGAQLYRVRGYQYQPTEYAQPAPSAEGPMGAAGQDVVWVDGSPGDGSFELETQDPEIAAAFIEGPQLVPTVMNIEKRMRVMERAANVLLMDLESRWGLRPVPRKKKSEADAGHLEGYA